MQKTKTDHQLLIDTAQLRKAALVLRAINHPLRRQILHLLHKHKEMPVTEVYTTLRLDQPVASAQLAILRHAGFVNTKRVGKQIFYSVNYSRISLVSRQAKAINDRVQA